MDKICAIIVNYNAGDVLAKAVDSLLSESVVGRIIVIDNDSSDSSMKNIEKINQPESRILCIRNSENLGFARACNIGIAADAGSDYLLFLNPDCIVEPDALSKMLSCLKSSPGIGMVGPLLLNSDGTEQAGGRRSIPTPWRSFVRAFGLSKFRRLNPEIFSDFLLHEQPLPEQPVEVEAISGSCMLVRRDVFKDVGHLDAGYFLHCEDLDWCARLHEKNWKMMFVPDARVTHYKGVCSQTRPIFVEWHKHKGMVRFYKKFHHHQYPGLLWLIATAVWIRFSMVFFLQGARYLKRRLEYDTK
ncbi:MAG: glycosyltransferase family 2 protein [Smithella sp.]|nr:glycosyltransferase family 2 protein [Smithella sp.]